MTSAERREARYQRRKAKRDEKLRECNNACGSYEEVFSFDNLYAAYKKCCKGVGWKASTQNFKANALANIYKLHQQLMRREYRSKGFIEFDLVERGKPRHIRSVHISERIVQRCLCDNCLVPLLGRSFIYDNGASMKGKGIDFTMDRLTRHLEEHYREHGEEGYAVLFDFSGYFDNADHEAVFRELKRCIFDPDLLAISMYFVVQFGDVGLGLGSQVSQIDALALASPVDHLIKDVLGVRHYSRYMDDGYLLHISKDFLNECLTAIREKCRELGIKLNEKKTQIVKLSQGIKFLKTRFFYGKCGQVVRIMNHQSVSRMRRKLRKFRAMVNDGRMTVEDVMTSLASWRGTAQRCNAHRAMERMAAYFNGLFPERSDNICTTS